MAPSTIINISQDRPDSEAQPGSFLQQPTCLLIGRRALSRGQP
jgi:hypothetical protein